MFPAAKSSVTSMGTTNSQNVSPTGIDTLHRTRADLVDSSIDDRGDIGQETISSERVGGASPRATGFNETSNGTTGP